MGFLDKAKAAAEQAAAKAKGGVEDVQLKRELGQAYGELGKQAFELVESGALSHADLEPTVAKIREPQREARGGRRVDSRRVGGARTPTSRRRRPERSTVAAR